MNGDFGELVQLRDAVARVEAIIDGMAADSAGYGVTGWAEEMRQAIDGLPAESEPAADQSPCGWWDGPSDHVYGVCNRSAGHKGRHLEFGPSGEIWAAWGGGNPPLAPPTRGGGSIPPWLRVETPAKHRRPHSRACGIRTHAHGPDCHSNCPTCGGRAE